MFKRATYCTGNGGERGSRELKIQPNLRMHCGIHEMRFLLQAQNSLHVIVVYLKPVQIKMPGPE